MNTLHCARARRWLTVLCVLLCSVAWMSASAATPPAALADGATVPAAALAGLSAASLRDVGRVPVPEHPSLQPVPHAQPSTGTPFVLYMGAEYCPFCAAERWPLVLALMRFGTFSDLKVTRSSATDVYPDTATFSFVGSHYQSRWLDFRGVELSNRLQQPLEKPTRSQLQRLRRFDRDPYTQYPGSIPFIDINDQWIQVGASFSPGVLQGMSFLEIAHQVESGKDPAWQAVMGSTAALTHTLCGLTKGRPRNVCQSLAARKD